MSVEKNGDWRVFWVDKGEVCDVTYPAHSSAHQEFHRFNIALKNWNQDANWDKSHPITYFATEAEAVASIDPENFKQLEMMFFYE